MTTADTADVARELERPLSREQALRAAVVLEAVTIGDIVGDENDEHWEGDTPRWAEAEQYVEQAQSLACELRAGCVLSHKEMLDRMPAPLLEIFITALPSAAQGP